ncbi:RSP_2648 family PIN domain-containing protein [uncultured Roseobacter sp.]|uniref:RSP_2648 family PIN domain-containing protein n=1 Tax=uncultured Roseobacter sp. TaxID=114847 RepID=UPI002613265A|nr:PIN domain-containing protein [uncultured Roseobacter sp.]
MKILIDTCVLYPTVMREIVLSVARRGAFEPVWSPRILEEWARAAVKLGPEGEAQARSEIALLRAAWPGCEVTPPEALLHRLWLPDADDIHVFAAAVSASADAIMTLNKKDFPKGTLAEEGLDRVDPDGFLMTVWLSDPEAVSAGANGVLQTARRLSGQDWELRPLLKKARLPRLAKALG